MREIKFRAWNIRHRQMRYDAQNDVVDLEEKPAIVEATGGFRFATFFGIAPHDTNMVLMQYTGLKDKKGKQIYEGDIVKMHGNSIHLIEWAGGGIYMVGFCANMFKEGDKRVMDTADVKNLLHQMARSEVIGNIYENPELLKV
jgi:uncharacterized phage protein (TIGR01671 family)